MRVNLRAAVKEVLTKHGYPPDTQGKATQTVVEQAELICADAA
jgi:type I restriction enzyme R subunit